MFIRLPGYLDEVELLRLPELGRQLHGSLPLLVLHLVTPQPVLVEHREAGDSIALYQLVLQTIHRFSQSRRRPLLGPSPG